MALEAEIAQIDNTTVGTASNTTPEALAELQAEAQMKVDMDKWRLRRIDVAALAERAVSVGTE